MGLVMTGYSVCVFKAIMVDCLFFGCAGHGAQRRDRRYLLAVVVNRRLGGASPLHTRQGEVLAERQGCSPRGEI